MSPLFAGRFAQARLRSAPRERVAEALGADRDQRRARVEQVARRGGRSARRPCRRSGSRRARATARDLRQRDRADRRAGQPAGPAAEPRRPPARGCERHRAQRVDERDGVGAGGLGGLRRRAATSAVFGVSLTISGLAVSGRTRATQRAELGRVGADVEAGLDVRAGDVELDRGDLVAGVDRLDERGDLVGRRAHDVRDQRHGQPRELGQVVLEVAVAGPCWAGRSS